MYKITLENGNGLEYNVTAEELIEYIDNHSCDIKSITNKDNEDVTYLKNMLK